MYLWEKTVACAAGVIGDVDVIDMVLYGGDFIDGRLRKAKSRVLDGFGKYVQWGITADTATQYFPGVPWVMTSGNHDGVLPRDCMAVLQQKDLPDGTQSLNIGNAHFSVLPYAGGKWNDKYEQIMDWLDADLAVAETNRVDWKIVSVHWGPYTTGDHGMLNETTNLVRRFTLICAKRRVDLVLQAHDHTFSKTLPYRWSGCGWTTKEIGDENVNICPRQKDGWDIDSKGTYYVSCGCAGHRVGENAKYASVKGRKSYRNRVYKIATGRLTRDSKYGRRGDEVSADLARQMFGILRISGCDLIYTFYVSEMDGTATLFDELKIRKTPLLKSECRRVSENRLTAVDAQVRK